MDDFLKQVLVDGTIIIIVFGILVFFVRKWITEAISHHFKTSFEKTKAFIDVEKQKELTLFERRAGIYAEMTELVYRLRNEMRECLQSLERLGNKSNETHDLDRLRIGEELYLLTESLYRYRAFIDEKIFSMLHRYKRILQDAQVLFNRFRRPEWDTEYRRVQYTESIT